MYLYLLAIFIVSFVSNLSVSYDYMEALEVGALMFASNLPFVIYIHFVEKSWPKQS